MTSHNNPTPPHQPDCNEPADRRARDVLDDIDATAAQISDAEVDKHLAEVLRQGGFRSREFDKVTADLFDRSSRPTRDLAWPWQHDLAEEELRIAREQAEAIIADAREQADTALSEAARIDRDAREKATRIIAEANEGARIAAGLIQCLQDTLDRALNEADRITRVAQEAADRIIDAANLRAAQLETETIRHRHEDVVSRRRQRASAHAIHAIRDSALHDCRTLRRELNRG